MTKTAQRPDAEARKSRGGFSLAEVVVSMVVLIYGLLGLAGSTMYFVREVRVAELSTKRTVAVRSTLERARAMPFDSVGAGLDSVGEYELNWTATAETTRTKLIRVIATGPGLMSGANGPVIAAAAVDTIDFRTYRP